MSLRAGSFAASAALFALLVAEPAGARAPLGRFTASVGVVRDSKTGLNWQQAVPNTTYTHAKALAYCSGNVAALSGSGWRLPAIKELQTLVDDSVAYSLFSGPAIDPSAFPSTPPDLFWSSTLYGLDASNAWSVAFYDGNTYFDPMTDSNRVRCVR
jgi:hypothetical protein